MLLYERTLPISEGKLVLSMWCFLVHWLTPLLCCCMDLFPKVCRIISTAAPDVVSFKADDNLKPGEVEWANYIRVRLLLLYCCGDALSDTCVIQSMCGVRTSGSCTYVFTYIYTLVAKLLPDDVVPPARDIICGPSPFHSLRCWCTYRYPAPLSTSYSILVSQHPQ